jgi:uncharacterized protein YqjF (DUF2071 family)
MTQTWLDLLFAHWPIDPAQMRPKVPSDFEIDLHGGQAWVGVVPFCMTNVAPRGVPALPWVSAFPELNVRTYVRVGDKPGVYFFSLDAGNPLAVLVARFWLNLPYYRAIMKVETRSASIDYSSRRTSAQSVEFVANYEPVGSLREPRPGTLEYFLTERYCLYAVDHKACPYRLEIHHPPWALQSAEGRFSRNTMAEAAGIPLPAVAPLLHFSKRQDMVAFGPARIGAE